MLTLRPAQSTAEMDTCARLMAESEPWITLGRDFAAARRTTGDPTKELTLALDGGVIVGFVLINMHGAFVGYIQSVCVAPDRRGQGIGTALLAYAEAHIFRDSPNVFMCVSTFNADAARLYQRLGYETIGELRDYIVAGHGEILLRKTIGPLNGFRPAALEGR